MREVLKARISSLIANGGSTEERDDLLLELARYQADSIEAYGRLYRARGVRKGFAPAVPTDLFRYARLASFPAAEERCVFRTSGTTSGARGAHHFRDLALYDLSARTAAATLLFEPSRSYRVVALAEDPAAAPHSSLSYMLDRFGTWFGEGSKTRFAWLDVDRLQLELQSETPVALLGASFAFVHVLRTLSSVTPLPAGSVLMPTGGFKGRVEEISPAELYEQLRTQFSVPSDAIIGEYGMTELSSQLYEVPDRGRYQAPPWVRLSVVDSESLEPVSCGEIGLLRVDDPANLDSVCAVQTSDLAKIDREGYVQLQGRARGAALRGCSLTVEEALERKP